MTEPTTVFAVVTGAPVTSSRPASSPASHQPDRPEMSDGNGPENKDAAGVLPGASALTRARALTPVSSGAPGEVKRNATQLTVRVKVETVWLSPAAVSTHT